MRVLVWNENIHEKESSEVTEIYPGGLHGFIAEFLKAEDVEVKTATQDEPECGLTQEVLDETDVIVWWGHVGHHLVPDEYIERVQRRVLAGMGIIILHSGHYSKIFRNLMGTGCTLKWRLSERERLWTINPNHPIAQGIPETFVLECEEMYGEPFQIPEPQETVFLGWFKGGEVFRSGCTWIRGNGKVFYFQPGHEMDRSFHNPCIQRIIQNAVRWACPICRDLPVGCVHFEPLEY